MNTDKLPKTDSIEELTRFWDTHDLTDFESQLEEVKEPTFQRDATITIRLQLDEAETLRQLAKTQGVADTELIRNWVLEHIHAS